MSKHVFTQIAIAQIQPHVQPNGEFHWGQTLLYALDSEGQLWAKTDGYGDWARVGQDITLEAGGKP